MGSGCGCESVLFILDTTSRLDIKSVRSGSGLYIECGEKHNQVLSYHGILWEWGFDKVI